MNGHARSGTRSSQPTATYAYQTACCESFQRYETRTAGLQRCPPRGPAAARFAGWRPGARVSSADAGCIARLAVPADPAPLRAPLRCRECSLTDSGAPPVTLIPRPAHRQRFGHDPFQYGDLVYSGRPLPEGRTPATVVLSHEKHSVTRVGGPVFGLGAGRQYTRVTV